MGNILDKTPSKVFHTASARYVDAYVELVEAKTNLIEKYNELEKAVGDIKEAYHDGVITRRLYDEALGVKQHYRKALTVMTS